MKQSLWFYLVINLLQVTSQDENAGDYYKATIVEFRRRNQTEENIKIYKNYIDLASKNNVDIIVFPESTLISEPKIKSLVPHGSEKVIPCKNQTYDKYPPIKEISEAAAKAKLFVVVNLDEFENCTARENGCPQDGHFTYNTNVVFDRSGTVIARYRKYNLFEEFSKNSPKTPELVTFETDFGVTFGMFTCFDILFKSPALDLYTKQNVTNFIFPSYWFSELPFLTAPQIQAGWSFSLNVNLLAVGGNLPKNGTSGSGFYHGREESFQFFTEKEGDFVITGFMPKFRPGTGSGNKFKGFNATIESFNATDSEMNLLSDPSTKNMMVAKVLDVNADHFNYSFCSGSLCCKFDISYRKNEAPQKNSDYRAVVYSGERNFGKAATGHVDYCAVVLCLNGNNCAKKPPNNNFPLTFDYIKIEGNFKAEAFQMPDTLIYRTEKNEVNLQTINYNKFKYYENHTTTKDEKTITMEYDAGKMDNLMTFGIFGRQFINNGGPTGRSGYLYFVPFLIVHFFR